MSQFMVAIGKAFDEDDAQGGRSEGFFELFK